MNKIILIVINIYALFIRVRILSKDFVGHTATLTFITVSQEVHYCDKRMEDQHPNYPPNFGFISNLFIKGGINNHPDFESGNQ